MKKQLFMLAALVSGGQLWAQPDSVKTGVLDDVTVTANKIEQKQSQTGKVVSVITKEQLEKAGGKTLPQLLNEQAGITINGAYNNLGSVQTVFMRGASAGRTLILVDGIPMYDPSNITNDYDLNLFSLNDIERIEICRGAESTIYGSDAVAGVINIITVKKDIDKPFNVKATTSFGSLNTTKNNVQAFGKAGKLTYNARFGKLRTDGFSAAYDSSIAGKRFDRDGYDGNVGSASLLFQATKALSFKTFAQLSNYRADIDAGGFVDKRNYFIKNKSLNTGVGANYKAGIVNISANYQYNKLRRHYNDNASIPGAAFSTNDYYGMSHFAELYAGIRIIKQLSLLVGGDFRYGNMSGQYVSSSFGATNYKDTSMNQYAGYASLMFSSDNKRLNIELGGRLNKHSRYGNNNTFTFNPSYVFAENWRVFGSIATGFKAPGLYQLYDAYSGNKDLEAEESKNYELGVQHQNNKFSNRITYFYREIENGIDYNNTTFKYFNFLKQIVRGVELETSLKATDKLTITGNYTYISSTENTQSRVNFKDTTYSYLLRRPKHNINLSVGYQFTPAFYISVQGKFVGDRYDAGGYKKKDEMLEHYFLLNAYASYTIGKHVHVFVDAQNITDKKFFDVRGYNAIPFIANGGITFNW